MILPGHIAGGYLTTVGTIAVASAIAPDLINSLPHTQIIFLTIAGTLLGDGPDIDILFNFIKQKSFAPKGLTNHRDFITHTPLFWFVLGLITFLIGLMTPFTAFLTILAVLLFISPLSHLVFDSFEYGVRWLWPFSNRYMAVNVGKHDEIPSGGWVSFLVKQITTPLGLFELFISIIALFVALM